MEIPALPASLLSKGDTALAALLQALSTPQFYIALLVAIAAVISAVLLSGLMRRSADRHSEGIARFGISPPLLSKALVLLPPLFTILMLAAFRPLGEIEGPNPWLASAAELASAWLLARAVLLVVRTKAVAWFIVVVIFGYTLLSVSGSMRETTAYLATLAFEVGKFKLSMLGLIQGIIIFVIVFWLAGSLSHALENYLRTKSHLSYNARALIVKFFTIFVYFIAFLTTLSAIGVDLTALAVFGGALGVGVGLGLQKITANFVSGITILFEKSIKIGDLIEVGPYTGWVRQLHMRYALLETFDGREVLIPNDELISQRVTNWTYSNEFARIEIRAVIEYASDAAQARTLMLEAARAHPRCLKEPEASCNLREFGDNGLVMVLTFWIPDVREGRFKPQSDVMFDILGKFRTAGIQFAEVPPKPAALLKN